MTFCSARGCAGLHLVPGNSERGLVRAPRRAGCSCRHTRKQGLGGHQQKVELGRMPGPAAVRFLARGLRKGGFWSELAKHPQRLRTSPPTNLYQEDQGHWWVPPPPIGFQQLAPGFSPALSLPQFFLLEDSDIKQKVRLHPVMVPHAQM